MLWIRDILVRIRIRASDQMDPDPAPDPAIFVLDLQDAYYFLKVHLHNFSTIIVIKKLQNSRNQGFSYYFCLTNGSGSRRPKDILIIPTDPDP